MGHVGILDRGGQGQITCPLGDKVVMGIKEIRKYPRWLWMVGLVPSCLGRCLKGILEEHMDEGEVETCT